ncbi:hypothetical protein JTB14_015176 [Gonioctena quinquepunctata]|nr:hypothetical protein JTB14_015176 [Gonioctena quinquepunctata]
MNEISNNDLLSELEVLINNKTPELKPEIQSIRDSLNGKLEKLEEKCNKLEHKIVEIERFNKRNNIVIFGIEANTDNVLEVTTGKLNEIFNCSLSEKEVNNIYLIGKKGTIILEFISYLQKLKFFQNLKKLQGTGISVSHDLGPEDQATNKILLKHLKSARVNNYQAHIKNHKLYVNGTPYTPKELQDGDKESEAELLPKANSAPPTPSTSHKKDSKKDTIENTEVFKSPIDIEEPAKEENPKNAKTTVEVKKKPTTPTIQTKNTIKIGRATRNNSTSSNK